MTTTHPNIKAIEKRFINTILGSFSIIFFSLYITSKYILIVSDILKHHQYIYLFSSFTTLISCILLNNAKYNFKKILRLMSVLFTSLIIILNLSINYISFFKYMFIIPVVFIIYLITNKKNVIKIALLLMLFFIATTYLLDFHNINFNYEKKNTRIVPILTLLSILINSFYSLVIIKFSKDLAIWDYNFYEAEEIDPDPKLKQLFNQIMNYVVKEKGYMNSDINKKKLAKELKTNQTYLSMALSVCGNITFTELVNENRIKYVTEEIANNSHKKFTIEHIYKNAGFNQQSTFNRVFKEFTGMTPSEYIDSQSCLN